MLNNISKLLNVVSLTKNDISLIVMYGSVIGFLSLVVPIAAQNLVTMVSFGTVIQPILVLTLIVFILLICAGVLRILQAILVENIQQRIFVKIGLTLAADLTKVDMSEIEGTQGGQLINRFFEVVSIQKNIGTILLSGAGVLIQSFFGLFLLAAYHPYLLVFDIIFISLLVLTIIIPFPGALATALDESEAKYEVAGWFEEMVRVPLLFRFLGNAEYACKRADDHIYNYIANRQKHFRKLIQHFVGTYIIQIFASTSVLFLGGILVVNNQVTLGQLVATEIIVTSLGVAVTKLGRYLENIYDLLASSKKVSELLSLKMELENSNLLSIQSPFQAAPSIHVDNLVLNSTKVNLTRKYNFSIASGERAVICGAKGKTVLIDTILGFKKPVSGMISFQGIPLSAYSITALRKDIDLIRGIQYFDGSLLDNLKIDTQDNIVRENLQRILNDFNLSETINHLKEGLNTNIHNLQKEFSSNELQKLMFIRPLLNKPKILVVDEALDSLAEKDCQMVLNKLMQPEHGWTLIVTTRHLTIAQYFKNRIYL